MAFLNRDTGELTFSDGTRLSAGLPLEDELSQRLNGAQSGVIRLQSRSVQGGRLVPICTVEGGAVQSVTLCVSSIGGKEPRTSARQRAFLFARMGLEDPCPDTQDCVRILCPFGEMLFVNDPHTLRPEVRLTFTAR